MLVATGDRRLHHPADRRDGGAGDLAANPFKSFDQITVDPFLQLGALASRSSRSPTLFNAFTNQPIGQTAPVFAGVGGDMDNSGPDGVVIAGLRLWGTDYPSLVRVFDLLPDPTSPRQVAVIDTGGTSRADSIDYDPFTRRVAVANGDTSPAFITLISTTTLKVTNRIVFDGTNGTPDAVAQRIGTVLYDYAPGSFLATVTQLGPDPARGAIAVMDPRGGHVTRVITGIDGCEPSTLAEGPGDDVIVACDPGEDFVAYDLIHRATTRRPATTSPTRTRRRRRRRRRRCSA